MSTARDHDEKRRKALYEARRTPRALPTNCARWRKLRAHKLAHEPLCRYCKAKGIIKEATELDHADGDHDNNADDNLVPSCRTCNSRKAASEGFNKGKGATLQFGVDGEPLVGAPAHWK